MNRFFADHEDFATYWARDDSANFSTLSHHSHPYFVIANAFPKFQMHFASLTASQRLLYDSMARIMALWRINLPETPALPSSRKRKKADLDEGSSDGDDEDSSHGHKGKGKKKASRRRIPKKPKNEKAADSGTTAKGKGKPHVANLCSTSQICHPKPPQSALQHTGEDTISYYDKAKVSGWINGVIAAGSPETVSSDIIEHPETLDPPSPPRYDWDFGSEFDDFENNELGKVMEQLIEVLPRVFEAMGTRILINNSRR
jgi:hypothetical protein